MVWIIVGRRRCGSNRLGVGYINPFVGVGAHDDPFIFVHILD